MIEESYRHLAPKRLAALAAQPRAVEGGEIIEIARLWLDGWGDAHAGLLPPELARHRTLESFIARLRAEQREAATVGPAGAPLGFYLLKGDELNQFYVSREARGKGVASVLLLDAEARLAHNGVDLAWLACAIGNDRAARFYEKSRWRRGGTVVSHLPTPEGTFDLEVWRYEKRLRPERRV